MIRKKLNEKNHVNSFKIKQQQQNACISIILVLINWKISFAFTSCWNRKETLVKAHIKPTAEENKRQLSLLWGRLAGSVLSSRLNLATKNVVASRFHLRFRKAQIMKDYLFYFWSLETLLRENILWLIYCSQVHQCLCWGGVRGIV